MLILFVHGALVRDADWWWARMPGPLARLGFGTAAVELPSCVGPGDLASTYVVCTEDRAIPAEAQRAAAARADRTVEIPTGHHPFLSRPDLLAEVIAGSLDPR